MLRCSDVASELADHRGRRLPILSSAAGIIVRRGVMRRRRAAAPRVCGVSGDVSSYAGDVCPLLRTAPAAARAVTAALCHVDRVLRPVARAAMAPLLLNDPLAPGPSGRFSADQQNTRSRLCAAPRVEACGHSIVQPDHKERQCFTKGRGRGLFGGDECAATRARVRERGMAQSSPHVR